MDKLIYQVTNNLNSTGNNNYTKIFYTNFPYKGDSDISKNAKHIKENKGIRKLKPSLIPRRQINTRKGSTETSVSSPKNLTRKPYTRHKNVQRVQHLNINQGKFK